MFTRAHDGPTNGYNGSIRHPRWPIICQSSTCEKVQEKRQEKTYTVSNVLVFLSFFIRDEKRRSFSALSFMFCLLHFDYVHWQLLFHEKLKLIFIEWHLRRKATCTSFLGNLVFKQTDFVRVCYRYLDQNNLVRIYKDGACKYNATYRFKLYLFFFIIIGAKSS